MVRSSKQFFTPTPRKRITKIPSPDGKVTKKRRRSKPGTVALREIRYYQRTTGFLIRKLSFWRLVRQIVSEIYPFREFRWQENALAALQEMTEVYLTSFFEETNFVAVNAKRVTIQVGDMHVVRRIRGLSDPGNY